MLCPISVLLSFCYSFYVVLNTEWNQNGERMVSETLTSATVKTLPSCKDENWLWTTQRNELKKALKTFGLPPVKEFRLEYQTQLLQRDGDSALRAWKRQIETTKGALAFSTDITLLQQERCKLETRKHDLTNAYRKLIDMLDSEESKSNATENNETFLRETEEVCKNLNERISQL